MSAPVGPVRMDGARREAGMALVAVMWMVAALSLLVSSLIYATRTEIRSVQQLRDATDAAALGDAAIQLAASELDRDRAGANAWHRRAYRFAGREVRVTVVPSAGLVNLNKADPGPARGSLRLRRRRARRNRPRDWPRASMRGANRNRARSHPIRPSGTARCARRIARAAST